MSADQDARFLNKEKKLLKSMKFPTEFSTKARATTRGGRRGERCSRHLLNAARPPGRWTCAR